ncbi:MAG: NUDIX domain-containing protein [Deltaproteobacteria bacterium]|nr:NUDIX domain-containing protein [Deltaproteobacteria bacterium]
MIESTKTETLEVVDENNQVIGTASRWEIHQKALRHRSVHIFIFNSRGDLYLQKRSPDKDQYPEHWDSSAAGHTDPGESPLETAQRELMEELGLQVKLTEVLQYPACPETGWEFATLFKGRTDDPIHLNLEEATTGDYFSPDQLSQFLNDPLQKIAPGFRLLYSLYHGKYSE